MEMKSVQQIDIPCLTDLKCHECTNDFKRTNKLDFTSTTIHGDVAWATYNLHSSITANGKDTEVYWMETVILIRDDDKKWKIKVLHSTRVNKS